MRLFKKNYIGEYIQFAAKTRTVFKTGFTLLETLVGVTLLLNVLIGPVAFLSSSFMHIKSAEDRLTALYLAQEGLELTRRIRDNNVIAQLLWNGGLAPGTYIIDYNDVALSADAGQYILYNGATGIYSHDSGVTSKFRRWIEITSGGPDDLTITVFVQWSDVGVAKQISLELGLRNWE